MNIYKKITLILFIFVAILPANAVGSYFSNSLVKLNYLPVNHDTVHLTLYMAKPYMAPLSVSNKAENEYVILLPETKNEAVANFQDYSYIKNIKKVSLMSASYPDSSKNGYTKVIIKTVTPLKFELDTSILPISALQPQTTNFSVDVLPNNAASQPKVNNTSSVAVNNNLKINDVKKSQQNTNDNAIKESLLSKDNDLTVEIIPKETLDTGETSDLAQKSSSESSNKGWILVLLFLFVAFGVIKFLKKIKFAESVDSIVLDRRSREMERIKMIKDIEAQNKLVSEDVQDIKFEEFDYAEDLFELNSRKFRMQTSNLLKSSQKIYQAVKKQVQNSVNNSQAETAKQKVSSPIMSEPELIAEFNINENRGFYLVKYTQHIVLAGFIGEKVFVLKRFSEGIHNSISAKINMQNDGELVYFLKVNHYRAMIGVYEDNMKLLLEL